MKRIRVYFPMPAETVWIAAKVPPALKNRVKRIGKLEDRGTSQIVRIALRQYCDAAEQSCGAAQTDTAPAS